MKAAINATLLTKLAPKDKPYDVRDDKLTGFLVRVNISGKLVYMCEFARGKRITIGKVGVLTPAQARDKALSLLGDATKGIDPRKKNNKAGITLKDFIELHYKPWIIQDRKSGERTVKHIIRCFFEPFGHLALKDLTPVIVDQWRTQRLKLNTSAETVNRDMISLKSALSKAVLWEFIEKHPLEKLKQLKSDNSVKVRYLSKEEEKRLRKALINRDTKIKSTRNNGNQWRKERNYGLLPDLSLYTFADYVSPMVLLSLNTGLRQGEIFNLQWRHINFERATLTIEGNFAKSGRTRHIPLNTEALSILHAWREQSETNDFIFANHSGDRFNNVKKSWTTLLKHADIQHFRWHDMRHHFASRLVMAGVDLNTVRELLGHSDLTMTLRYAHLAPEHKANAVEKLVSHFSMADITE